MKHCAAVLLFSLLLAGVVSPAFGQAKFDKAIKAVNEQYELGNYEESNELLSKFQPKVERKLGKPNRYSISILLAKSRNALAQGMTSEFENQLQEAVKLSLATNPNASEDHAAVLIEGAELFRRQGNIIVALRALGQAKETLRNRPADSGGLRGRLQLTLGECLTEQGFYREAYKVLSDERAYFENRAARQENYTDNRGQAKTRKLDESEVQVRFSEYARLLTAVANVSRKNGDLTKADTAFQHAGSWISRNLGKYSAEYVRNQIDYSNLFMENGLAPTQDFPNHAGLEQAYNNIREKHKPTHYLAIEALEQYIKRVNDQGNVGKFASLLSDYERLITDYMPKNSLYNVNRKLFDLNLREVKSTTGNLASEAAILLTSSPNLPRNHVISRKLNQFLFDFSVNQKNYRGAEPYLLRAIDIRSALIGKDAPETHLDRLMLANFQVDYTNKLKEALAIYHSSYDSVVAPQIGYYQKDHLNILSHLATIYELTDQYQTATQALENAGRVARNKYSTEDPLYAAVLIKSANLRVNLGQYQIAESELGDAFRILNPLRKDPAWKVEWVNLLESQARLAGVKGSFTEAEEFLDKAQTVIKKSAGENLRFDDQGAARNLTTLYIQLGRYALADEMLEKTIAEYERVFGQGSIRLIEPLVNKGMLQLARGEYPDAEKTATRAYTIAISVYGENSTKSAVTQKLLAELNFQLGDYEQAEDNFQKTIKSQQSQFGREHLEVARSLSQLGMVRFSRGDDPAKILPVMEESRRIISEQLGNDNPPYAEVLKNLAVIALSRKKFTEALTQLTEAEQIWTRKTGSKNSINAASIFALTGDVYYYQRNYPRAEVFYNRGKDIYESNFSKNHPEYVKILSKLSRVYYMTKDYKKSKKFVEEAFMNYETYIK
ncbi:MAG: tetratricopeptide repeat protein, partial [Bacteroidota bacterium]